MAHYLPPAPEALHGITAFQSLPPAVMAWLLQAGQLRHYADGEPIVGAGAMASSRPVTGGRAPWPG